MSKILNSLFRDFGLKTLPSRRLRRSQSRQPRLEFLEDRTVPSVTLPTPGTPAPIVLTGTDGPDAFIVRVSATSSTTLEVSDNGGMTFASAALVDVTQVTVNGLGGNDHLIVDMSNGLVAKAGGLPITFDGGAMINTLILQGN